MLGYQTFQSAEQVRTTGQEMMVQPALQAGCMELRAKGETTTLRSSLWPLCAIYVSW